MSLLEIFLETFIIINSICCLASFMIRTYHNNSYSREALIADGIIGDMTSEMLRNVVNDDNNTIDFEFDDVSIDYEVIGENEVEVSISYEGF